VLGQDRLGMELNSEDRMLPMLDDHDRSIECPCRRGQTIWKGLRIDHQRVIASYLKLLGQTGQEPMAGVPYPGGFAMHGFFGSNDSTAEGLADGLMSQANA